MWEQDSLVPELNKIAATSVLDLRPVIKGSAKPRIAIAERIRELLRSTSEEPDCIFLYARPSLLSEELFAAIRERWKAPLLGMNLDDKHEFFDYRIFAAGNDNYQSWAKHFDLNLSSSRAMTEVYRRLGLPALYLPGGFHPKPATQAPPQSNDFKYPLSFLGSCKPERAAIINRLRDAGVPIRLFGTGWPESAWIDEPETVFRQSQINLGIGFYTPHSAVTNLKARDFECPGAGACYLTTYNWELADLFDLGKEILCYRSVEELIEMYHFYSVRPAHCLQIAQAAHRRCLAEYTWEQQFRRVFRELGFKA